MPPDAWEHRRLYHGTLVADGERVLDEVMVAVMVGPESYTGEDMGEISCHGSMLIVNAILEQLYRCGAHPAEPGEFTKRAFLNGKIDLIQAEAICDLIHARSHLQRRVAQEQLGGSLSNSLGSLADELVSLLATVEASIDFIEEDIEPLDRPSAVRLLERHARELERLLAGSEFSRPFREGFRVAIAGPVNAGKSSLFNRLVGAERAIVTDIPGTTRDLLREPVLIDGLLFLFHDTAGLRERAGDRVEEIGVGKTHETLRDADCVLFVIDGSQPLTKEVIKSAIKLDNERSILVVNKNDLTPAVDEREMTGTFPDMKRVSVSALTGAGCDALRRRMLDVVGLEKISRIAAERVILNTRLIHLLRQASERCRVAGTLIEEGNPLEIVAVELRELLSRYEEATGRRYSEQILDTVFSRFCIGK